MSLRALRSVVGEWRPTRFNPSDPLQAMLAAWPAIVGENVAAHSAPLELSGDALVIATRSSAWSQQLQFLSDDILRALGTLPEARQVARLVFRSGALRRPRGRAAPAASARPARPVQSLPPEPAADQWEALDRFRRRVASLRRHAAGACSACGAPLEECVRETCAPCEGAARHERLLAAERILFMAPWLGYEQTLEQVAGLEAGEYERARRALLQRWWLMLERARRSGKLSKSGIERKVASSYVLLQSRLRPDRVSQAVMANLLGEELQKLLWGKSPPAAKNNAR
ncbi:MAG: DciA family protein [Vulcanimicrobiaceae bacterium]